ncbi:MAG: hypothetical protein COC08_01205 [Maribacter sp.]|nr:MAG: hypothetical protein COC08_01205 [Maribacter sp.]
MSLKKQANTKSPIKTSISPSPYPSMNLYARHLLYVIGTKKINYVFLKEINNLDPRVRGMFPKKHFLFRGKPLHRQAGLGKLNPQ